MKTFIIAEAGVNHNRDIGLAKKLVDIAVEAGADAVKFQTFKAEEVISEVLIGENLMLDNIAVTKNYSSKIIFLNTGELPT
ncbi:hypothetical protein JZK55_12590 [Dissulfurispira thermophila]|uniref:PseI/NeuA/B-like domain-containing protein n=1 Tax=Dissulfurispira thermophila TaxID=2715679 RepID=A0A7G1H3N7_9BACT|nr:N-acetylneuraminate synthase family protein [Dissulfurispira thermophila]BCB96337.1 hypothetical protein JZK55_12590 [Dissulfurispira thermophila]